MVSWPGVHVSGCGVDGENSKVKISKASTATMTDAFEDCRFLSGLVCNVNQLRFLNFPAHYNNNNNNNNNNRRRFFFNINKIVIIMSIPIAPSRAEPTELYI